MAVNSQELKDLIIKIEKIRRELIILIIKKGDFLDPNVTSKSEELDKLLNKYKEKKGTSWIP